MPNELRKVYVYRPATPDMSRTLGCKWNYEYTGWFHGWRDQGRGAQVYALVEDRDGNIRSVNQIAIRFVQPPEKLPPSQSDAASGYVFTREGDPGE